MIPARVHLVQFKLFLEVLVFFFKCINNLFERRLPWILRSCYFHTFLCSKVTHAKEKIDRDERIPKSPIFKNTIVKTRSSTIFLNNFFVQFFYCLWMISQCP